MFIYTSKGMSPYSSFVLIDSLLGQFLKEYFSASCLSNAVSLFLPSLSLCAQMDVDEYYRQSKGDRLPLKAIGNSGVFSRLAFNVLKFTVYGIVIFQIFQTVTDIVSAYRILVYEWGNPLVLD